MFFPIRNRFSYLDVVFVWLTKMNWKKDKKQWFRTIAFQVTPEWKLYTFEFTVPAATPDSTVSDRKFTLIFGLFQNSLKDLYVKNVVWEELP